MDLPSALSASNKGPGTLNSRPALFRGEHSLRWFRLYSETIDDPKVQLLPDYLFKTWINLLCLTCRHDGLLPPIEDMAFTLRLTPEETTNRVNKLKELGLIEAVEGTLQPHNWNGRQYKSDVSTERVKRFRKQARNGAVTPPDTDTDTDTERTTPSARKARGNRPAPEKVSKAFGETRHTRIQQMVMAAYQEKNQVECPWDGSEAKQLQGLLAATPHWQDQQIAQCLMNFFESDFFPVGSRPREWLQKLPKYLAKPLKRENGHGQVNSAEQRSKRTDEKYSRVLGNLSEGTGRNLSAGIDGSGARNLPSQFDGIPLNGRAGSGKTIDAAPAERMDGITKAP
jgi:DNA-binding Lrp family transcriptional regulator